MSSASSDCRRTLPAVARRRAAARVLSLCRSKRRSTRCAASGATPRRVSASRASKRTRATGFRWSHDSWHARHPVHAHAGRAWEGIERHVAVRGHPGRTHLAPRSDGLSRLSVRNRARTTTELRTKDALLELGASRLEKRQRAHGPEAGAHHGYPTARSGQRYVNASPWSQIRKTSPSVICFRAIRWPLYSTPLVEPMSTMKYTPF